MHLFHMLSELYSLLFDLPHSSFLLPLTFTTPQAGKNHDFFKKIMTFFLLFYLNRLFLFKSNISINIL